MKINLDEQFPLLPHAPIVEAAIEVRARAERPWKEDSISAEIRSKLPDYPKVTSRSSARHEVKLGLKQEPHATKQELGWRGLVFQSENDRHIAQFNRDGFVFSRIRPYESWQQLYSEAMRLWTMYAECARPTETLRIGVRFINRIVLPRENLQVREFIKPYPEPPCGLDPAFFGFFHQDTLAIPGYPYALSIVRTLQNLTDEGVALILDIDAFTIQPIELTDMLLPTKLNELRWLKNKAFFGSITPTALKTFQ